MLVYPLLDSIVTSWAAATTEESESLHANITDVEEDASGSVVPFSVWRPISAAFLIGTILSGVYPAWLYHRGNLNSATTADKSARRPPNSHP